MNDNYTKRAKVLIELKRYKEAKEYLYQALASNPKDFLALELIASCYYFQQDYRKAIEFAELSIGSSPQLSSGYSIMAESYRILKQHKNAEGVALEGLKNGIFPDSALFYTLGACAYDQKNYKKSLEYVDMGLQRYPQERNLLRQRSLALAELKDLKNAESTAVILLSVAPESSDSFQTQGKIALLQGKHHTAVDLFLEAIRLYPTDRKALEWLHESAKQTFWFYRFQKRVKDRTFHRSEAFNRFYFGSLSLKIFYIILLNIFTPLLFAILIFFSLVYFLLTWFSNTLAILYLYFHPTIKHTLTATMIQKSKVSLVFFVLIAMAFLYFSFK